MSISLKNIHSHARPGRHAVLVDENIDVDWKKNVLRVLDGLSLFWGGHNTALIPIDEEGEVSKNFDFILKKYQPDYLESFPVFYSDLKYIDPELYQECKEDLINQLNQDISDEEKERLAEDYLSGAPQPFYQLEPSESFQEKAKGLNPFYRSTSAELIRNFSVTPPPRRETDINEILLSLSDQGEGQSKTVKSVDMSDFSVFDELLISSCIGRGLFIKEYLENYDDLSGSSAEGRNVANISYTEISSDNSSAVADLCFANHQTAFGYTNQNLVRAYSNTALESFMKQPTVIFVGDSLIDFCAYFSLSNIYPRVFWVPKSSLEGEGNFTSFFINKIRSFVRNSINPEVKTILTSLSDIDLSEVKRLFEQNLIVGGFSNLECHPDPDFSVLFGNHCQFLCDRDSLSNNYMEQFHGGIAASQLKTPFPRIADSEDTSLTNVSWVVDIEVTPEDKFGGSNSKYTLPQHPASVEDSFSKVRSFGNIQSNFRATKDGFSFHVLPNGLIRGTERLSEIVVKPRIKIKPAFKAVRDIFKHHGYEISLSDKGSYIKKSLELFGGLSNLVKIFKDEKQGAVIEAYNDTDRDKDNDDRIGVLLKNPERVYLELENIQNIYDDEEKALLFLDSNLKRGVLQRGVILFCSHCKQSQWYHISDIDNDFKCSRCTTLQEIRKENWKAEVVGHKDLRFHYSLAEVLYQGINHNMEASVITADYLKKSADTDFLFVPDIEIYNQESSDDGPNFEIDFAAIYQGGLYLGECKTNSTEEISDSKIENYASISKELMATFIFSTTEEWSEDKKTRIKEKFDNTNSEVKFLDSSKLFDA